MNKLVWPALCALLLAAAAYWLFPLEADSAYKHEAILETLRSIDSADDLAIAVNRLDGLLEGAEQKQWHYSAILNWGIQRPDIFSQLLERMAAGEDVEGWAHAAVDSGKSFLLIERMSDVGAIANLLVDAVRKLEQHDNRRMVSPVNLRKSPALMRISKLSGHTHEMHWQGAAILVDESHCQLALITAGHNVYDVQGRERAPIQQFSLEILGREHRLSEIVVPPLSLADPVHDWALLFADKTQCGEVYVETPLDIMFDETLPLEGLDAGLYCFHESKTDVVPQLYGEQCQVFPSGPGVLDYYAGKASESIAIHSCISEAGSSGCPLLVNSEGQLRLLATQVEGDNFTGAGIARLMSNDLALAVARIKERFARHDGR